jgi:hypothetical protein
MELYRTIISIDINTGAVLSKHTDPEPVKTMPDNEYIEGFLNLMTGKSLEEVKQDVLRMGEQ